MIRLYVILIIGGMCIACLFFYKAGKTKNEIRRLLFLFLAGLNLLFTLINIISLFKNYIL